MLCNFNMKENVLFLVYSQFPVSLHVPKTFFLHMFYMFINKTIIIHVVLIARIYDGGGGGGFYQPSLLLVITIEIVNLLEFFCIVKYS